MPLAKLTIPPGFVEDITDYGLGPRWRRGDMVRFWAGFPEKIGGWVQHGSDTVQGACRGMHAWSSSADVAYVAMGTHSKLEILLNGTFADVTPAGLSAGRENAEAASGWGSGGWGEDGWGESSSSGALTQAPRTWSLDNWGEDLIANPRGGEIYTWDSSVGTGTAAAILHASNSPLTNFVFVSPTDRHLIALGSDENDSGTIDKMLVHWCDQEDFTLWTAAATNTAGTKRLDQGSELISGINTRGISLLWTDTAVYAMQFVGPSYTFGFDLLAKGCGIIAPHARAEVSSRTFWWSRADQNFYVFDGAVRNLPCPVLNTIRADFNVAQQDKIFAVANGQFNEVWFYYCSASSIEIDKYVVYNYLENLWFTGNLARTAGVDRGIHDAPLWCGAPSANVSKVYEHESGTDDDGSAITSYIETGEFEAEPGDRLILIDRLIPDADITGNLDITIYTRRYPNATQITKGPYAVNSGTGKLSFRAKGRQFALRFGSDAINDDWRLGTNRIRTKVVGGR